MIPEALVKALQERIEVLEHENTELKRDNARYANAHAVLMRQWEAEHKAKYGSPAVS